MQIVLDEHFGMSRIQGVNAEIQIKPVKVMQGRERVPLQVAMEGIRPSFFAKAVPIAGSPSNEEIEYFRREISANTILYFHDPRYSPQENLLRIRNWLLPEKHLLPVPIWGNRVQLFYLIHAVSRWMSLQKSHIGYQDLLIFLEKLEQQMTSWILSPKPMSLIYEQKRDAIHKPDLRKMYKQIQQMPNGKIMFQRSGSVEQLWNDLLTQKGEHQQVWAVRKGTTAELPEADYILDLPDFSLPIHVPYVQILFVKEHTILPPINPIKVEANIK